MELVILGHNGPFPESGKACSGYLLRAADALVQFDFGTGTLSRLTALTAPEELTALFLSHWHFDHTSDLLPLVYRLEAMKAVLPVYAPVDEQSPMRKIVSDLQCFRLTDIAPGEAVQLDGLTVRVGEARHPVPGVMYRVEAEGRSMCYTGDTNTLPGLADFCRGTDLLLADGLFTDALWTAEKPHLSARLAAELARDAGAAKLIITHLNPVIDPETLLREAREVRRDVLLAAAGMRVTV